MKCLFLYTSSIYLIVISIFNAQAAIEPDSERLTVAWTTAHSNQELKNWGLKEIQQFKRILSHEKDPQTGKVAQWNGILLSHLVQQGLDVLPSEKRAQIDLVILKNKAGETALMPRALVSKYPILLALDWPGRAKDSRGPIFSVVPWSSRAKILKEDLPLEKFFIPNVVRIELANYRDRYSSLFLKRRTDPAVMRGEKLFIQNCMSCHSQGQGSTLTGISGKEQEQKFASIGHPNVHVTLKLLERDRRSIVRYLDAYRVENTLPSYTQ